MLLAYEYKYQKQCDKKEKTLLKLINSVKLNLSPFKKPYVLSHYTQLIRFLYHRAIS